MKEEKIEPNRKLMLLTIMLWFFCTWMLLIDTSYEFGVTVTFLMTIGFLTSHLSLVYNQEKKKTNIGFEVIE